VVRKKSLEIPYSVTIKGEVVRPGLYPITFGKTLLSSVIQNSGGFTENAFLADAKVIRFNDPIDNLESNPDYSRLFDLRLSDMGIFDREYFNLEAILKRNQVSVDFPKLFIEKDSTQDIILQNGDLIIVPQNQNTVLVLGQVPRPGHQQFVPGEKYKYYIEKAGGTTNKAMKDKIRIIKAGSKNWVKPNKTKIQPGDTVWIPRKRDITVDTYLDWTAKIVGALGSIFTIILLAKRY
jgi:protein involved in polysaccharide export with SLBB domain